MRLVIFALALLMAFPVMAAPETGKEFGDWRTACEPKPDGKGQTCHLFQNQTIKDGKRLLLVRVGPLGPKGEAMMIAEVPLGIDLTLGAAAKIEPGPQITLMPLTCTPDGCRVASGLDAAAMAALIQAKALIIGIVPYGRSEVMQMPVSVNGLADGLGAIK